MKKVILLLIIIFAASCSGQTVRSSFENIKIDSTARIDSIGAILVYADSHKVQIFYRGNHHVYARYADGTTHDLDSSGSSTGTSIDSIFALFDTTDIFHKKRTETAIGLKTFTNMLTITMPDTTGDKITLLRGGGAKIYTSGTATKPIFYIDVKDSNFSNTSIGKIRVLNNSLGKTLAEMEVVGDGGFKVASRRQGDTTGSENLQLSIWNDSGYVYVNGNPLITYTPHGFLAEVRDIGDAFNGAYNSSLRVTNTNGTKTLAQVGVSADGKAFISTRRQSDTTGAFNGALFVWNDSTDFYINGTKTMATRANFIDTRKPIAVEPQANPSSTGRRQGQYYAGSDSAPRYRYPNGNVVNLDSVGSGGAPGGSNTQVQYNNNGAFGGSNVTWVSPTLTIPNGTTITSPDAGTLSEKYGASASADGASATALGNTAIANGDHSVVVGQSMNNGTFVDDVMIGYNMSRSGFVGNNVGIGSGITVASSSSIVIGKGALAGSTGTNEYAFGNGANCTTGATMAFGVNTFSSAAGAICFGGTDSATGTNSTIIGQQSAVTANNGSGLGANVHIRHTYATGIGSDITSENNNTIILGRNVLNPGLDTVQAQGPFRMGYDKLAASKGRSTIYHPDKAITSATQDTLFAITPSASAATFIEARVVVYATSGLHLDSSGVFVRRARCSSGLRLGTVETTFTDTEIAGWACTISLVGSRLVVLITGSNATNWHGDIYIEEMQ